MGEQQKREKEFKDWQDACAKKIEQSNNGRPPDFYIKAKIYDRDMKGGIFKVNDAPLEKGIAALIDFPEEKFQNGVNGNRRRKATENEKSNKQKTIPNIL